MFCMPRVAIKGTNFILETTNPLTTPQRPPVKMPPSTALHTGAPARIILPTTTPDTPKIDPSERSMPPVMMTIVSA